MGLGEALASWSARVKPWRAAGAPPPASRSSRLSWSAAIIALRHPPDSCPISNQTRSMGLPDAFLIVRSAAVIRHILDIHPPPQRPGAFSPIESEDLIGASEVETVFQKGRLRQAMLPEPRPPITKTIGARGFAAPCLKISFWDRPCADIFGNRLRLAGPSRTTAFEQGVLSANALGPA